MTAMNAQDEFFDSLLGDFLDESVQLLSQLNEDLLELDQWAGQLDDDTTGRCDDDLMNRMFRSAHSIKGLSAMLGLRNINSLTHRVENVFDAVRKDQLGLDSESVELIFHAVDLLGDMVEHLRLEGSEEVDATAVVSEIQGLLEAEGCESKAQSAAEIEQTLETASQSTQEQETPEDNADSFEQVDYFDGISDETELPAKYLSIFVDEAFEAFDCLTDSLLNAEGQPNAALVERLLVTSHRLKGSAASLGLNRPAKLAHLMEDVLQELREGDKPVTSNLIDALLPCTDALRSYVEGLKDGDPKSHQFNQCANDLMFAHQVGEPRKPAPVTQPEPQAETAEGKPADPAPARANGPAGANRHRGTIHFEPRLATASLKAELIYEKLIKLGHVSDCQPPLDQLDASAELSSWSFSIQTDYSAASIEEECHLSGVQRVEFVDPSTAPQAAASQNAEAISPASTNSSPQPAQNPNSPQGGPDSPPAAAAPRGKTAEPTTRATETLRVDVERLDQLMNLTGQLVINKARFAQLGDQLRESMLGKQAPQDLMNARTVCSNILTDFLPADGTERATVDVEQLRSQIRRMDSSLEAVQREVSRLNQMRINVTQLGEAVHQLDRVAEGIQKSVMDTRMVPIGPLFARFRRVVRDITRGNGKKIELHIQGEKTELDKQMIDALGDPLIHMVRNSADHGIETPDQRTANGKSPNGKISLNAFHRGNNIYIEVQDDGAGLDIDRITAKALEKGVVTESDLARMSPHQIYQLIWEPGFSTAEKVTEISGRGMGMDIVRSKIEEISGQVDVDSEPGKGSTFTIKLPLTMAILPSLMTEIQGDILAFPIESVVEIVRLEPEAISSVQNMKTATIRGRVISVVELDQVFAWNTPASCDSTPCDDWILVILGHEGQELGLRVNSLMGEEDIVIKSLAENYRNVRGIAGASILGDGRVSLILDVPSLIEMAMHIGRKQAANEEYSPC